MGDETCGTEPAAGRASLETAEAAHSRRVVEFIAGEIVAAGGWLSFERYMDLVLYAPGLGYYSAGARKLGRSGDFTTAPEVSPLFGACVAWQCAEILAQSGGSILELGAGTGRLAVDVLTTLEAMGCLPERYSILEISADLKERQQAAIAEHIPQLAHRVKWLDAPPGAEFAGVILANEVLDALPVTRFRWRESGCDEWGVTITPGGFEWRPRPASAALQAACAQLAALAGDWEDGYVSEYCPRLPAWTRAVTQALRRGAVLWFDYGLPGRQYYLAERHGGTLITHFRHRAVDDPFLHPGLADLSAWVDFTALARAADTAGFDLAGFSTQAHFLAACGIDRQMQRLSRGDEHAFARLAGQARRLLLPGEMGEAFKVMAWTRGLTAELSGFGFRDLRDSL